MSEYHLIDTFCLIRRKVDQAYLHENSVKRLYLGAVSVISNTSLKAIYLLVNMLIYYVSLDKSYTIDLV